MNTGHTPFTETLVKEVTLYFSKTSKVLTGKEVMPISLRLSYRSHTPLHLDQLTEATPLVLRLAFNVFLWMYMN